MPTKKTSSTVSVSVDKATYKTLKQAAAEEDRTIGAVIRRLVREAFEPEDRDPTPGELAEAENAK